MPYSSWSVPDGLPLLLRKQPIWAAGDTPHLMPVEQRLPWHPSVGAKRCKAVIGGNCGGGVGGSMPDTHTDVLQGAHCPQGRARGSLIG